MLTLHDIMSIKEIADLLRKQANLRSLENDEGGILEQLADTLEKAVEDL